MKNIIKIIIIILLGLFAFLMIFGEPTMDTPLKIGFAKLLMMIAGIGTIYLIYLLIKSLE